ncbi:hypothetical protein Thiowin_02400 [Thiorhodovibrio winogradskyi]|uniref:Uncharacterized protein n=1 Tax=Thiorhodovibrio winogradskyi TaxID=77007 RepID=A0ABZ0S8L0_9GAMM
MSSTAHPQEAVRCQRHVNIPWDPGAIVSAQNARPEFRTTPEFLARIRPVRSAAPKCCGLVPIII